RPAELEGVERMLGLFINTLPVRVAAGVGEPVGEWLRGLQARNVEAMQYEFTPLTEVQRWSELKRGQALFDSLFVFENYPMETGLAGREHLEGLRVGAVKVREQTNYPLALVAYPGERLTLKFEYDTARYTVEEAGLLLRQLGVLLEAMAEDPSRKVCELPLPTPDEPQPLTDDERRRLLALAGEGMEYPQHLCLHELFERQVRLTPDAPALTSDGETLSYAELNARANQLAHYLRRLGVTAESRVALLLERSAEMVVALLGVLKAGGCYVPLDPQYPSGRLAFMLEDSGAEVILTDSSLAARLPADAATRDAARLVRLDAERDRLAAEPAADPGVNLDPDGAAYVIYTSGSTGRPKGVVVTHANVGRLFDSTRQLFSFSPSDVWTLFHSYAFDFSVWELWGALLHGGRLVVVPYWVSRSPEAFRRLLADERVTVLSQTPSAFRQLIAEDARAGDDAQGLALRAVVFGGEALEPSGLRGWVERHGDTRPELINMYGITETTVHVTYRRVTREEVEVGGASAVGRAVGDLRLYALGAGMEPAPEGVAGELYVGGAGLARGYLNRPGLTAERFIPDPYSEAPGARLYRTGDVGRWVRRGGGYEVEYLGRCDQQVKVRGFRIELGEIEAALCGHEHVREAAVLAREGADGHRHLVAYVVAEGSDAPGAAELRQFVSGRVPEHMVPSFFVGLERLPLTPNGKLDRRALPEPEASGVAGVYAAPRSAAEEALCEIWRGVLGVERVGIDDNFFELGGDSIRSIQLKARAQQLGLDFDVQQLFRHQTVRELARAVAAAGADAGAAVRDAARDETTEPFGLVAVEDRDGLPTAVEDAYPLTHLQAGMAFHSEYSPESAIYHDIFSFHLRGPFDAGALRAALARLAARHPALRTSFALNGLSEPLQLVHREVEIPLAVEDLRGLSDGEQEAALDAWMEEEKRRGFDWARPPLLRFHVHLRGADAFQLTLSFHHIILDGWSVASMNTELFRLYFAELSGAPGVETPAPANVFRDFVAAERRTLSTPGARDFWARRLSDATLTPLPRWEACADPAAPREIRLLEIPVAQEVSDGLKRLAGAASAPVKTVLLAAHLRVMALLAGQRDVLTGVVSNGRPERADGERALGLFLNTLPFRLALGGGTWLDLVRETFEAELELLPHRLYPMAEVQRMRGGERLFETMFNYTHFHVYQGLAGFKDLQVLKGKFYQETSLTLSTHCKLELSTGRVNLSLEYDARQLCDAQIQAVAGYYDETLRAMALEPGSSHLDRALLPARELAQLARWNDTARETRPACLGEMFEAQAARTPDADAVVFGGLRLTYAGLNARANGLARHLRRLGVGPDVRVGICVERSLEMAVALLAVLKAGGAYVPLDPEYPEERLRLMLEDAGAPVILTQRSLAGRLPARASHLVALDADWPAVAREREENFECGASPENLAYVLFTSGSTGRPKGVAMSHGALANLVGWQTRHARAVGVGARTLQFASINFDVSFQEFFATWCAGGTLVLVSEQVRRDPSELLDFVARERVERLFLPFVALRQLAEAAEAAPRLPGALREVVTAGEQLQSTPSLASLFRRLGGCTLENQYGPTESHVVTSHTLDADPARWAALPPIGTPVANTQIHVLDASLQPAPVAVAGELYIGGANLARGYLGRP
ncbi:MAG TPA: amino acid adenylation domain-containing protein, partial [Pyrinomonadaceae bacterium]